MEEPLSFADKSGRSAVGATIVFFDPAEPRRLPADWPALSPRLPYARPRSMVRLACGRTSSGRNRSRCRDCKRWKPMRVSREFHFRAWSRVRFLGHI